MKIIKRKMNITDEIETADHNLNEHLPHCQASFNSDGNITLRNYDRSDKNKDEIIILSDEETRAVIKLLAEINHAIKGHNLPF